MAAMPDMAFWTQFKNRFVNLKVLQSSLLKAYYDTDKEIGGNSGVYGTRRTYEKSNKLTNFNFKNVTFILLLIVLVNDLNWENRPHMGYPHPPGSGWKVSEKLKSDFFYFFSVNKKYKEKTF